MVRIFTSLNFLIICVSICAQELKIESVIETTEILSANMQRQDANGFQCAVLRIILPQDKASFEGSIVGDCEYKNGEYWVYVSPGTKRIRIKYNNLNPLMLNVKDYSLLEFKSRTIYEINFENKTLIQQASLPQQAASVKHKDKIIIKGFQDGPGQRAKLYINGKYRGELFPGNANWQTIEGETGEKCKVTIVYESKYERKRTRKITVKFGEHNYIETQSTAINAY